MIFNKKNIWINLQNPDPVRIYFDLYNNKKWMSVLKLKDTNGKEKVWKDYIPTFYSLRNFAPPYSDDEVDAMKKLVLKTMNESIKNTRMIRNMKTKFKRSVKFY